MMIVRRMYDISIYTSARAPYCFQLSDSVSHANMRLGYASTFTLYDDFILLFGPNAVLDDFNSHI